MPYIFRFHSRKFSRHSMEVTHFSDHGNQGCQSDAPWRKIEKKSPGGVRLTRDGERSKSTFCGKMYNMKMKFTFHWLFCTFSRLYTINIIMQDSMAMRCLNIFDVWLYYTFPGWWNAFESPMYQFFLKNRRNVVESSNVPPTVMVIQSGSFFREFRTGGICRGSTAWIISCGRRWWKHVTLALYLIYKKAEREKTMGWHSMAMKITLLFWCFYYWGLVLGQPFQSILRSTETNGCSSCVSWPGAGNFNRKFLSNYAYTPEIQHGTWKMMVSNRNLLFQGAPIFRFHVCFWGGVPLVGYMMLELSLDLVKTCRIGWKRQRISAQKKGGRHFKTSKQLMISR